MDAIRNYLRQHHVGLVALFFALSAGAYALPGRNTVDSGDIKPRAVKRSDLGRNSVNAVKVRDGSIGTAEITDESLTGADVNEGSLGVVPQAQSATQAQSAANAANADTVDGIDSSGFLSSAPGAVDGANVADESLTGFDVDESTLAIGDHRIDDISWSFPDGNANVLLSDTIVVGHAHLRYDCPATPTTTNGNLEYHNLSIQPTRLYIEEHDGTAPDFVNVAASSSANIPVTFLRDHLVLGSSTPGRGVLVYDLYTEQTALACTGFGLVSKRRP